MTAPTCDDCDEKMDSAGTTARGCPKYLCTNDDCRTGKWNDEAWTEAGAS